VLALASCRLALPQETAQPTVSLNSYEFGAEGREVRAGETFSVLLEWEHCNENVVLCSRRPFVAEVACNLPCTVRSGPALDVPASAHYVEMTPTAPGRIVFVAVMRAADTGESRVYRSETVEIHPGGGTITPRTPSTGSVVAPPADFDRVSRASGDAPRQPLELERRSLDELADHPLIAPDRIGLISVGARWLTGEKISSAVELLAAVHFRPARQRRFLGAGLRLGRGALDLDEDGADTWHLGLEARAGLEKHGVHLYAAAGPILYRIRNAASQGGDVRHVPAASLIAGIAQSESCDWDQWSGPQLDSSARDHGFHCLMQALLPDALEVRYELWRDAGKVDHHIGIGTSYYFDW